MSDDNFAKGVQWDLSDLYASIDSPKISEDLKLVLEKSQTFSQKYKPSFEALLAEKPSGQNLKLNDLLKDYEEILMIMTQLSAFAYLCFAEKNNPERGAFLQKIQVSLTDAQLHLVFFEVYWTRLDDTTIQNFMKDPSLEKKRHFLEKIRIYAPHTLTEEEENILSIKANTSARAFSRLFDETSNNMTFEIELEGKKSKKNKSEILSLAHSKNREERKKAAESLAEGLKTHTHLLTYIYNMILADHRSILKIRKYNHPMDPINLANEMDQENVMNLINTVKKAHPIVTRYYQLKKRLLGLDELYDYDRYAPIDQEEGKIPFEECKKIVLEGYDDFSKDAGKIAEQFFSKRWIDAEIREGKQGGGFCASTTPNLHPYILVNYTGSLRDVMTVAHELGHGLHQYLAGKRVGILESDSPLTLAETASVFGEMLIFEKILKNQNAPEKRLALICGKIDDNFATVFRQIALTHFELSAHTQGLEKGELSDQAFSDAWIEANREIYQESVILTESYRQGWKYIPHFVHTPFYCYAYAFAQLFVLSLFQKYKMNKTDFTPKYLEMLSLGGSKKPVEIANLMGLDLRDPHMHLIPLR
ncbi:MAG: M3 family oligoendopeptidase [Chlamydiae bacterium]|nr:M3 family oligoendopeptidase [Chlamydiota bacterium]